MEAKTMELYQNLLSMKKTVKGTKDELLEFVSTSETLKDVVDQSGKKFMSVLGTDKYHKAIQIDKIIIRLFDKSVTKTGQDMLYWSCCDFFDILALGGGIKGTYNKESDRFDTVFIRKDALMSFYGRDIKFAFKNIPTEQMNPILERFGNDYINKDHPLSDNIFYTIYIKNAKKDSNISIVNQFICCARDSALSPRPERKEKEEVNETPPVEMN